MCSKNYPPIDPCNNFFVSCMLNVSGDITSLRTLNSVDLLHIRINKSVASSPDAMLLGTAKILSRIAEDTVINIHTD